MERHYPNCNCPNCQREKRAADFFNAITLPERTAYHLTRAQALLCIAALRRAADLSIFSHHAEAATLAAVLTHVLDGINTPQHWPSRCPTCQALTGDPHADWCAPARFVPTPIRVAASTAMLDWEDRHTSQIARANSGYDDKI